MAKWLMGCESSGRVREEFRKLGHDAWSCDLKPAEDGSPFHLQCDVREAIGMGWDGAIFFPDCTNLCSSGLHWNMRRPGRALLTEQALEFVRFLMSADIPKIGLENPVGRISTAIRKYDQKIQPYEFGDDASKGTCLWLKNLPPLVLDPAKRVPGRWVMWKGKLVERWANQTDSGQNKIAPGPMRATNRARTYPGIAAAMAAQWGGSNLATYQLELIGAQHR